MLRTSYQAKFRKKNYINVAVNHKFSYIPKLGRMLKLLLLLDPLNMCVRHNLKYFIQHRRAIIASFMAVYGCEGDRICCSSSFLIEQIGQTARTSFGVPTAIFSSFHHKKQFPFPPLLQR